MHLRCAALKKHQTNCGKFPKSFVLSSKHPAVCSQLENRPCGDPVMFGRAAALRLICRAAQHRYPAPIERYTPKYPFHGTQDPASSVAQESRNIWASAVAFGMAMIGARRIGRSAK